MLAYRTFMASMCFAMCALLFAKAAPMYNVAAWNAQDLHVPNVDRHLFPPPELRTHANMVTGKLRAASLPGNAYPYTPLPEYVEPAREMVRKALYSNRDSKNLLYLGSSPSGDKYAFVLPMTAEAQRLTGVVHHKSARMALITLPHGIQGSSIPEKILLNGFVGLEHIQDRNLLVNHIQPISRSVRELFHGV
ncbi:uncharacterized protein UTRI_06226 [Ustilago trichophora]|uniref:Uncharacterized protein n=1 Tax=Ustilago trichophora TaxID=86804 RepID=A0A5C3EHQ9_9BASI|nr:uncharacterized protein UTRI_06226 [Ustilago trichophora]